MGAEKMIDLDHLDRYVAGDRSLRDEILGIFEEQAEMWLSMLDPQADDAAWKDAAHALKGASRGVGAWDLGDLCQDAESLVGDANQLEKREEILGQMRATSRETVDEVRRLRSMA